ncbi:cell division protein ZapA [Sphingomonas sp. NBWT7]|uniref:cell division protein ZapA n=1 Tax=Sphingomonas sp. NBWT7 TaxID=2596913 RepID=UPI001627227C|nr:cell division protein ZapA [Sphingomonas sp. NBWT7]QNE31000.1 cell division protein ZapA [Sphingomonas sp. NBWT7]
MARVTLEIGGNRWPVNCRDGEEAQVRKLGAMVEARWDRARRAAGDTDTARAMLLIALMLADELNDAKSAPPPTDDVPLAYVADRLEALAAALEHLPDND